MKELCLLLSIPIQGSLTVRPKMNGVLYHNFLIFQCILCVFVHYLSFSSTVSSHFKNFKGISEMFIPSDLPVSSLEICTIATCIDINVETMFIIASACCVDSCLPPYKVSFCL